MRANVLFVCLVLLAVLATITDASLVSDRRHLRSALQPTAEAVLRSRVHAKHGAMARVRMDPLESAQANFADARKALEEAEAKASKDAANSGLQTALTQARASFSNAQYLLEQAQKDRDLKVSEIVGKDATIVALRAKVAELRADIAKQRTNHKIAKFDEEYQKLIRAEAQAAEAARFSIRKEFNPAALPAAAKYAAAPASAAAPAAGPPSAVAGISATAEVVTGTQKRAQELAAANQANPLNQMYRGIQTGARELDDSMRASMAKDGVIDPDGWFARLLRAVPNAVYRVTTSPGTTIGKISVASHRVAEQVNAGKNGADIAGQYLQTIGPELAKVAATAASAGASAGADSFVSDFLVNSAQDMAIDAASQAAANALQAVVPNPAAAAPAVAASPKVVSEVIELTKSFPASGKSRVRLAVLLAASGRVDLGASANAALNNIGLPATPLSPVDVARVFLRVKFASGSITQEQYKDGEFRLDRPATREAVMSQMAQAFAAAQKDAEARQA